MPNGTYGGVRGRKTKVGRKLLLFSSYSIAVRRNHPHTLLIVMLNGLIYVMLNLIQHLSKEIAGQARNDGKGHARNDGKGLARNDVCLIRPHGRF